MTIGRYQINECGLTGPLMAPDDAGAGGGPEGYQFDSGLTDEGPDGSAGAPSTDPPSGEAAVATATNPATEELPSGLAPDTNEQTNEDQKISFRPDEAGETTETDKTGDTEEPAGAKGDTEAAGATEPPIVNPFLARHNISEERATELLTGGYRAEQAAIQRSRQSATPPPVTTEATAAATAAAPAEVVDPQIEETLAALTADEDVPDSYKAAMRTQLEQTASLAKQQKALHAVVTGMDARHQAGVEANEDTQDAKWADEQVAAAVKQTEILNTANALVKEFPHIGVGLAQQLELEARARVDSWTRNARATMRQGHPQPEMFDLNAEVAARHRQLAETQNNIIKEAFSTRAAARTKANQRPAEPAGGGRQTTAAAKGLNGQPESRERCAERIQKLATRG